MRKVPITLSLPESLVRDLHLYVSKREISKFVAENVVKGLEEEKKESPKNSKRPVKIPIGRPKIKFGIL